MTLNYVTLTLDGYYPGGGSPAPALDTGFALFTPSVQLTDPGVQWTPPAPVQAVFRPAGGPPSVQLLATDNAGPQPTGWGWTVTFEGVPGNPAPFTFFLPFAGGATQNLSALSPVSSVVSMAAFMPAPSGTATGGAVPVATGSGNASAWTTGVAGLAPRGTGLDDLANIQGLLNLTGVLALQPSGQYNISGPIVFPAKSVVTGGGPSVTGSASSAPTCINALSTFSGHSMLYAADAGSNPWAGPYLRDLAVDGSNLPSLSYSYAATNASPCVFTATGNAFVAGQAVTLSGSPPSGFTAGTVYYVVGISGSTFQLATDPGNTAIGSTSTGSGTVTGGVDAYRANGWVHGTNMTNVSLSSVTGRGINSTYKPSNGGLPSAYTISELVVNECYLGGIYIPYASDSDWFNVYQIGSNGGNGWDITSCDNSHFVGCRAEWNGGYGFHITGGWYQVNEGSTSTFTALTTDRNTLDGLHVDATGNTPLVFTGCSFRRDGRNGGSGGGNYAGAAFATTLPVILDGLVVTPGVNDDGSGTLSPQYGISSNGSTKVAVGSGWVQGATGTTTGNTAYLLYASPDTAFATGPVSSPTVVNPFGAQPQLGLQANGGASATPGGTTLYQPFFNTAWLNMITPSGMTATVPGAFAAGSVTLANSVTATAIATGTVDAGDTQADAVYRIRAWGLASTTGAPTLTFTLAWGATTLITSAPVTMGSGVSNQQFDLEAELHFTAAGTVAARMKASVSIAANGWNTPTGYLDQCAPAAVTVNANEALAITAQWSAASASNTLTARYIVERVN